MEALTTEQEYLKRIAEIKWQKGFKCKKCNHKEFYIRKDFTRECKNCNHRESAIFKTAFQSSKIPIEKKMAILLDVQDYFKKNAYSDEPNKRISIERLALKHQLNKNSITLFFQTISKFVHRKNFSNGDAPEDFLMDLDEKARIIYEDLFGVLIIEGSYDWIYNSEDDILYKLITKLFPFEKRTSYEYEMELPDIEEI